ncbi:hypothetical protein MSAN_01692100 [Mycena sanguinolenta]|uniref:RING-type domain-containing protein n=1 Tax=Mycena sanguinolenta TaxID=230812 RepID=A0A8H6Y0B4_9AGAR|nr:hypothetical protein MSAN_01692100 [Mycena sanguinolenta]
MCFYCTDNENRFSHWFLIPSLMSVQATLSWHLAAQNYSDQVRGLHFVGPHGCTDGETCERLWTPPATIKPKKIKLFDDGGVAPAPAKPALDIFQGPVSTIIGSLPGQYTAAERKARVRIVSEQRDDVEAADGRARMLHHIAVMAELAEGAASRKQAREARFRAAWLKAESEAKGAEALVALERYRAGRRPGRKIRLIYPQGKRAPRDQPLTEDDLYLTDARPTFLAHPSLDHTCGLCLNAKSHPVKLHCGHSACYVCVRMELEKSWDCNRCGKKIMRAPVPNDAEAAEINKEHPGWDDSLVEYSWEGLQWPHAHPYARLAVGAWA